MKSRKHKLWYRGVVIVLIALSLLSWRAAFAAAADSWTFEWEKTVAAAKKEGELSFYGSEGYEKIFEVFQKRYPDIKVKSNTTRRGSEHGQAVMTERRAGHGAEDGGRLGGRRFRRGA